MLFNRQNCDTCPVMVAQTFCPIRAALVLADVDRFEQEVSANSLDFARRIVHDLPAGLQNQCAILTNGTAVLP